MAGFNYCEGCGKEFPNTHLVYLDLGDGYYCDQCIDDVMEDEE